MISCLPSGSYAQNHLPVYRDVIIELPHLGAEKDLSTTVVSLLAAGGLTYEGYCEQMKCLLIRADMNVHPDNTAIMNKLKDAQLDFQIKPTGKIVQVLTACHDPAKPPSGSLASPTDK